MLEEKGVEDLRGMSNIFKSFSKIYEEMADLIEREKELSKEEFEEEMAALIGKVIILQIEAKKYE